MIVYLDVMKRLADSGWSSYRIRRERVLPEGTMTRIRSGQSITLATIDTICRLCSCQPGDFLRYIPDEEEGI